MKHTIKAALAGLSALALILSLAACGERVPENPAVPEGPTSSDEPTFPDEPVPPHEPTSPEESTTPEGPSGTPRFTPEEFPRLDGSTATAPLAVAMAALMLGESEEDVTPLIHFSRTTNSYYNLLNGFADLLIASEGNEEVYAQREILDFEWEQTPFAIDAFVFVVNENNPVDSLTVDEVRRIYTGEITNWRELGGDDEPIIPLQRNPEAGSQSLMLKLVMGDTPMMEPPTQYVVTSMGGLMEAVRGYDASAGAIGYSVYYYAQEMRAAQGLKILKIEGVEPEPETIRSGKYPLTNPYYVVIPASAPEGSPTRIIRDWLLGEDGQRLAADMGYVSVMDLPTSPKKPEPPVGTRLFEEYTDTLTPGDYGLLIPYAGVRLSINEFVISGCLYGLMTAEGQVVVDPVYSDVAASGSVLFLTRVIDGQRRVAAADMGGKWCTGFDYTGVSVSDAGAVLYTEGGVTLMSPDGDIAGEYTLDDLGLTPEQLELMRLGPFAGGGGEWVDGKLSLMYIFGDPATVLYFDLATGETREMSGSDWYDLFPFAPEPEEPAIDGAWFVYDSLLGRDAPAILAVDELAEGGWIATASYYRLDGTPLPGLTLTYSTGDSVRLVGGLIEYLDANTATYYDMDTMEVVFRTYLGFEED